MTVDIYNMLASRNDLHWFCAECEKPAISAVKSDKEIEERCSVYLINECFGDIESKLVSKIESKTFQKLESRGVKT